MDDVIAFQWRTALEATRKHNSLEISGLGRFDVRPPKVSRKLVILQKCKEVWEEKLRNLPPESTQAKSLSLKLTRLYDDIETLKTKDKTQEHEDQHQTYTEGPEQ